MTVTAGVLDDSITAEGGQTIQADMEQTLLKDTDAMRREKASDAVVRRMTFFDALDARIFLLLNLPPHPRWMDRAGRAVSIYTNGGWIWAFGVLAARLLHIPKSGAALRDLLCTLIVANLVVEQRMKARFRRQRPFIPVLRAVVVGKKPGTWSFPSGHTANAFGAAWILSRVWPQGAPVFLTLASLVGLSRIYVGVHYPSDVLFGAAAGISLAESCRRIIGALTGRIRL